MSQDHPTNALGLDFSHPPDESSQLQSNAPQEDNNQDRSQSPQAKKPRPYVNPDRFKTGGTPRDKPSDEALAEKMARIREQNEKIKQRRLDVKADEEAFSKAQQEDRKRIEQDRVRQRQLDQARDENARRKMDKQSNREWDAPKVDDNVRRPGAPRHSDDPEFRGVPRGRGRGRGGRGGRSWARGRGFDSDPNATLSGTGTTDNAESDLSTKQSDWAAADNAGSGTSVWSGAPTTNNDSNTDGGWAGPGWTDSTTPNNADNGGWSNPGGDSNQDAAGGNDAWGRDTWAEAQSGLTAASNTQNTAAADDWGRDTWAEANPGPADNITAGDTGVGIAISTDAQPKDGDWGTMTQEQLDEAARRWGRESPPLAPRDPSLDVQGESDAFNSKPTEIPPPTADGNTQTNEDSRGRGRGRGRGVRGGGRGGGRGRGDGDRGRGRGTRGGLRGSRGGPAPW